MSDQLRETQQDISDEIEAMIPTALWEQYRHLSFAEMAEVLALAELADQLRSAERRWFEAEN